MIYENLSDCLSGHRTSQNLTKKNFPKNKIESKIEFRNTIHYHLSDNKFRKVQVIGRKENVDFHSDSGL